MKRIVILGRGASGKSTLARRLGELTGIPVIELDKLFWQPGLAQMSRSGWIKTQSEIIARDSWIMDGDLGPYDAPEIRLAAADTIILLDYSLFRCAWNAIRRSRERWDFWSWVVAYRWASRPRLMRSISENARSATLRVFRDPRAAARFLARVKSAQ